MRRQRVLRHIDALAGQKRYILWLACGHKVSVSEREMVNMGPQRAHDVMTCLHSDCPFCPDPAPEDVQAAKSATQIWKEAGEP